MKKKKKSERGSDGNATGQGAKALGRTRIEAAAHQLRPAPWNPRPEITSDSVADITASVREIGLIQPLVVIKDPDKKPVRGVEFYLVVAGHRRFRACVDAGLSPIPCDVIDCDVTTAKRVTMIENLQRKDVDPLMEADLIAGLIEGGMTQAEIAAETGRGEKWVARRANLRKLSKSWRKRVANGEQITIDCLEHIAAYPEEIQEKCKDAKGGYYGVRDDGVTWSSVKWQFERESRDLREVLFDTEKCKHCPNNTGCCPDLFDDDGRKDAKLGKCLDAKCFVALTEEAVDDAVAKAEKKGRTVVRNKQPYQCGVYGTTKKPTKTNTALYVYTDCNGNKVMEYAAPPPQEDEDAKRKAKEERKAEKEAARRAGLLEDARAEAADRFVEWIDMYKKDCFWPQWFIDCAIDTLCIEVRLERGEFATAVDRFAANTGFTASDENANAVYSEYLAELAEAKKNCQQNADGGDATDNDVPDEAEL